MCNFSNELQVLGTLQLPVLNDESSRVCRHIFCYKSLLRMQANDGSVIKCPLCRRQSGFVRHEIVTRNDSSRDQPRREEGQVAGTAQCETLDTTPSAEE